MAQFNGENDVNISARIDAPIAKGPMPRWHRKALDSSSASFCSNTSTSFSINHSATCKTPGKTPKKTPGRSKPKTPKTPMGGDRFIPNRANTQFEIGHFMIMQQQQQQQENCQNGKTDQPSPHKQEYQRMISESLHGTDINQVKIMSYTNKAPSAPDGHLNQLRVIYGQGQSNSTFKKSRYIRQAPERILDAPDVIDDYYLNLIDWGARNQLAVSLGSCTFIWNAASGDIIKLVEMESPEDYVSSVSWMHGGTHVAVGTSTTEVQLWDVEQAKCLRTMTGHTLRVGSLSWNSYILSSGCRTGNIHHHDVRVPQHVVSALTYHGQEVCGLKWSPDGRYLASGGNDNLVCVWAAAAQQKYTESNPLYTFDQHQSAVKALAWCPWHTSILASGGGTADRCIKFWNCNMGVLMDSYDTTSQVCGILWSNEYKELISGHGFANNQLTIWKYPGMQKITELTGHTSRVINIVMSPDETTVASVAADETLRLWNCFEVDPKKKTPAKKAANDGISLMSRGIR